MSTQPQMIEKYTAPTREQIFAALQESVIRPTLYRAGIDWYMWSYLGEMLWIPPHLENEPMVSAPPRHPAFGTTATFKADGRLLVKARYGDIWDDKPNKGRFNTGVQGIQAGWSVQDIVDFALTKNTERGVVLLSGDVEKDELAMAHSKKLVYTSKLAWADQHRKARAEEVQKFRGNPLNANQPDPPPTPVQRQAQAWLDQYAASETSQRYKCKYGCSDWSERDLYVRHMQVQHGETPSADEKPVEMEAETALLAEVEQAHALLEEREEQLAAREAKLREDETAFRESQARALASLQERMDKLEAAAQTGDGSDLAAAMKGKGKGKAKSD